MKKDNNAIAKDVFERLKKALTADDWKFELDPKDELAINFSTRGEDLTLSFNYMVDAGRQTLKLWSHMPFKMAEDKIVEGAVATSMINYSLSIGCFDYNVKTGSIMYRMTNSFAGGLISDEIFTHLLRVACYTIDEYNDKLLMISKGVMSLEDLYAYIHKD